MSMHEPETGRVHQLLELAAELGKLRSILLGNLIPDEVRAATTAADTDAEAPPEATPPDHGVDALAEALIRLRAVHLAEPDVAEALVGFLAGLGKEQALTDDGGALLDALHDSEPAEGLRRLWVALTLNTIDTEPDLSAAAWATTMLDLTMSQQLDGLVSALRPPGVA